MLKTTEAVDVLKVLKGFSALGYADQTAMDNDIIFIADMTEIRMRDAIGIGYYDYLKTLNGSFLNIWQKSVYYAEVYAIARDLMDSVANKNKKNSTGQSVTIPGFSRSQGSGIEWFINDRNGFHNKYIQFMYTAGFKVNQINGSYNYFINQLNQQTGEYK